MARIHAHFQIPLFIFIVSCFAAVAQAQDISWNWLAGPNGSHIAKLLRTGESSIIALTSEKFYASSDLGANWRHQAIPESNQRIMSIASNRDGVCLMRLTYDCGKAAYCFPDAYYLSHENGSSWKTMPMPRDSLRVLSLLASDNRFIMIGEIGGRHALQGRGIVLTSDDNGISWQSKMNHPLPLCSATYAANDSGLIVIHASEHKLLISSDAGATWTRQITTGDPDERMPLSIDDHGNTIGWRSKMPGLFQLNTEQTMWSQINLPDAVSMVHTAKFTNNRLYASTNAGLFRSEDVGKNWQKLTFPESIAVYDICSASQKEVLLATAAGVFSHRDDLGWQQQSHGMQEIAPDPLIAAPNGVLYAGDGTMMWRSTDQGNSWGPVPTPAPGRVIALKTGTLLKIGATKTYRSVDTGKSWSMLDITISGLSQSGDDLIHAFVADIPGDSIARGIYSSQDDGQTWQWVSTSPAAARAAVRVSEHRLLVATAIGVFLRSAADAWQETGLIEVEITTLLSGETGEIYAMAPSTAQQPDGKAGGVFVSRNAGLSWTQILAHDERLSCLVMMGDALFVRSETAILHSSDAGGSWQSMQISFSAPGTSGVMALDRLGYLYAPDGNGLWRSEMPVIAAAFPDGSTLQTQAPSPNPVSDRLGVTITTLRNDHISAAIYDVLGRQVAVVANGQYSAGTHQLSWRPRAQASGVYFLRLQSSNGAQTHKFVIAR